MMRVWPLNSRHPLSTYEWWIFVNHFWNLMEGLENNSVQSDEDSFPSDHAACTVWTNSRHQKNSLPFAYLPQAAGTLFTEQLLLHTLI